MAAAGSEWVGRARPARLRPPPWPNSDSAGAVSNSALLAPEAATAASAAANAAAVVAAESGAASTAAAIDDATGRNRQRDENIGQNHSAQTIEMSRTVGAGQQNRACFR